MNKRMYSVWKHLLSHPGEWFTLMELAGCLDMSSREVAGAAHAMNVNGVMPLRRHVKCNTLNGNAVTLEVCVDVPPDKAKEVMRIVDMEYYHISEQVRDDVACALMERPMTTNELADMTGASIFVIQNTVNTLDTVRVVRNGTTYIELVNDVRENRGAPDTGEEQSGRGGPDEMDGGVQQREG